MSKLLKETRIEQAERAVLTAAKAWRKSWTTDPHYHGNADDAALAEALDELAQAEETK